jgi:hypothetical protein
VIINRPHTPTQTAAVKWDSYQAWFCLTLKALANSSPGRGPRAGSPRGVEVFALKPWGYDARCLFRNSEGVAMGSSVLAM